MFYLQFSVYYFNLGFNCCYRFSSNIFLYLFVYLHWTREEGDELIKLIKSRVVHGNSGKCSPGVLILKIEIYFSLAMYRDFDLFPLKMKVMQI